SHQPTRHGRDRRQIRHRHLPRLPRTSAVHHSQARRPPVDVLPPRPAPRADPGPHPTIHKGLATQVQAARRHRRHHLPSHHNHRHPPRPLPRHRENPPPTRVLRHRPQPHPPPRLVDRRPPPTRPNQPPRTPQPRTRRLTEFGSRILAEAKRPDRRFRSEERRVGKECRARW